MFAYPSIGLDLYAMSTKELKQLMMDRIKDIPDQAPASMVKGVLDAIAGQG